MAFKKQKSVYLLAFLTIILIGVVAGIIYFHPQELLSRSYADLTLSDNQLSVKLTITSPDQAMFNQFMSNLGANSAPTDFSLNLGDQTSQQLKNYLPTSVRVYLVVTSKSLAFQSQQSSGLESSLPIQSYHYATNSAEMDLQTDGSGQTHLDILDPSTLIESATSSGQLYLSNQLAPLFPSLQKVSTIEIEINGGSLKGSINLK